MAKKYVLVIVEGASDKAALEVLFTRFCCPKGTETIVTHGDITSDKNVSESNIINKVCRHIKDFASERKLKQADIQQVVHIIDTDGAFIPDGRITQDDSADGFVYSDTMIMARDISKVISRNARKRANVEKLLCTHTLWGIQYSMYYMSCDLDHALYNKRGSDDLTKERDAHDFAKKYMDDIPGFVKFIAESDFSVCEGYKESWNYIKQGENSLQRHTNLGLFFKENPGDE